MAASSASFNDAQSTLENTIAARDYNETQNQRRVQTKSFVIGKKVENQTGINLIDLENVTLPQEKQFPVKVLYVKPTHERKNYNQRDDSLKQEISKQPVRKLNNENTDTLNRANLELLNKNSQPKELPIQKQTIKSSGVLDQQKLQKYKHRPKSATSQQIKKDSIKHSKLGPNTSVKPQISYVNKVASSQRPKSAKLSVNQPKTLISGEQANHKDCEKPKIVAANRFDRKIPSPQKVDVDIPFTQNRFQGKFGDLTKDLIKKAQEALIEEKQKALKQKEELELKRKKQKDQADEVKQKNMELVKQQKEKGVERFDPRKKEQEMIDNKKKQEARLEREQQKELRRKRQEDSKKQLGLDIFDEEALKKHHDKIKELLREKEEQEMKKRKLVDKVKDHLKDQNQKRDKPVVLNLNRDLTSAYKNYQDNQLPIQDQEEAPLIDKKKLLEDQKRKKKQQMAEEKQKLEEDKQRKEEQIKKLQENTKKIREDIVKRKELEKLIQEEKEKLQALEDERQKDLKKKKKTKKPKSNHVKFQDRALNDESLDSASKMKVQIVKKSQIKQQTQNGKSKNENQRSRDNSRVYDQNNIDGQFEIDNESQSDIFSNEAITKPAKQNKKQLNKIKAMKYQLPGNSDIPYQNTLKFGAREDRYGLFSDNGYGELIEIKKRKIEEVDIKKPIKKEKSREPSEERANEIKLSKDGMVQLISKISEYAKLKEHQLFKEQIEHPERFRQNQSDESYIQKSDSQNRQVTNLQQNDRNQKQHAQQSVPGVINVEQEFRKQQEKQRQKEMEASIVIQKWARGYFARQLVREVRFDKQRDIEAEYGYFEDQVKFNSGYNLQKFLKEKQKLREQNKTQNLAHSSSIQEKIGDSSNSQSQSYSQMQSKSLRGRSAPQAAQQPQIQNFFREKSDKDSLSLIEIFARKNAPKIVPSVVKSPIKPDSLAQSQQLKKSFQKRKISHSDIDEEIYTESFERDDDQKSIKTDTVDEDIIEESKGLSSGSFKNPRDKKPFEYKNSTSIVEEEYIHEDFAMSMGKSFKSPNKYDQSIAEESFIQQQMSVSRASHQKRGSMREDSIQEELEASEDKQSARKQLKLNVQKQEKPLTEHQIQMAEFEKKMKMDEDKRKNYVNEMLQEMKRYEEASVSTVVVERMEKIINQSLAQKDKLLMGQRLHELELEKQHKDEINKIREEQIRLLSQLVLLGPNGASGVAQTDEERKVILENIQKIIDKPIVIQHQQAAQHQQYQVVDQDSKKKPQITVDSSSEREDYDSDYIEESKGLSSKAKLSRGLDDDDNDSIMESIQAGADNDFDEIEEDIEEASQQQKSNDDIEESIHIEGKKLKEEKRNKDKLQRQNNELQKMRYALGSEEALRKNSKNALKKSKGDSDLKGSGIFEKHSFQDFTNQKFKQFLFDQDALNDVMKEFEKAIEEKRTEKEERIKKKLIKKEISPRTFKKKNSDIERWITQERKDFIKKQQKFMQSIGEMGSFINKLDLDKKSMIQQIGSPRPHSSRSNIISQSSHDLSDINESSDESLRVRQARDQLQKLTVDLGKDDPESKAIAKKKKAAQKLIAEKEKAIEEGLKNKLKEIEGQQASKMLDLALNLDINKEIDKRINAAKRAIEESSDNFNEYSARSYSQSMGPISVSEDPKKKKNVKFASPEKYSSAHSQSMDHSSGGDRSSRYKSSQRIESSMGIDESIKIDESYSISGDVSNKQIESSKRSAFSHSNNKIQDSIKESVRDTIPEDSQDYSDDFVQSSASDAKQSLKVLEQSKNKLIEKANALHDQEDDIDYSMNFDESIGQSQQFSKLEQSQKNQSKVGVEKVDEESDEEDNDEYPVSQSSKNKYQKESDDIDEEEDVVSESLGASSKLVASHQEIADSAQDNNHDDKEILHSTKSVEWIINLEQQVDTQRSKKRQSDEEDGYSEDFEKIEEDYYDQQEEDEIKQISADDADKQDYDIEEEESEEEDASKDIDDLESFPDEIEESMDNYNERVDRITDEFLELLLDEVRENSDLNLEKDSFDEEEFKDKFPFNLIEEIKAPEPPKVIAQPKVEEKKEVKRVTLEDQERQKQEAQQKKLNDQTKQIESYVKLIVQTIDKDELIDLLEKPKVTDPLQKLAYIYQMDDLQFQNSPENQQIKNSSQPVLSDNFFTKVETRFKLTNSQSDDKTETEIQAEEFHHRAIFDAFNQALDIDRPYKERGQPAPWSKQTRVVRPRISESEVDKILKKCSDRVMAWCSTHAGTSLAPIPPAPPSSDPDNVQNQPPIQSEEERRHQAREEKLGMLMMRELEENEAKWIDYENEDAQVKIDLADQILDQLSVELAEIMMGYRKF
eukprot:403364494